MKKIIPRIKIYIALSTVRFAKIITIGLQYLVAKSEDVLYNNPEVKKIKAIEAHALTDE